MRLLPVVVLASCLFACATGGAPEAEGFDAGGPKPTDGAIDEVAIDGSTPDGGGVTDAASDALSDSPIGDAPPSDGGPSGVAAHEGTAFVSAGGVMTSPGFKMISTLGQSTIHQSTMTSPSFRLRGGLVGATGGK